MNGVRICVITCYIIFFNNIFSDEKIVLFHSSDRVYIHPVGISSVSFRFYQLTDSSLNGTIFILVFEIVKMFLTIFLHFSIFTMFIIMPAWSRGGGRYDHELIKIYSGAQVVLKIYSEPLWSYSEPLNFIPNPALFSQQLYFCFLICLNNFTKFTWNVNLSFQQNFK